MRVFLYSVASPSPSARFAHSPLSHWERENDLAKNKKRERITSNTKINSPHPEEGLLARLEGSPKHLPTREYPSRTPQKSPRPLDMETLEFTQENLENPS